MRKIRVTDPMLTEAKVYARNLFSGRRNNFEQPENRIDRLIKVLKALQANSQYINYLVKLKKCRNAINALRPSHLETVHAKYFNLSRHDLSVKFSIDGTTQSFADWVVWAMRFKEVRAEEHFMKHFHLLGIKTCVYCNSQFAVTIDKASGKYIGHYDLDHNLPKAEYPFLCTNFFNLVPCCAHCNRSKNDDDVKFSLYEDGLGDLDVLQFEIDEAHLAKYFTKFNRDEIVVRLRDLLTYPLGEETLASKFNKKFHIDGLCREHRDIIEELLWKVKIYNQSYISMLESQFSLLFPTDKDFHRFLLGNYDKPEDIHKRPLAKLIQDIARQLDMIN